MMKRKVCIVTGTRAEWGLLSGIARELSLRPDIELQIVATNMHLIERYGFTVREIETDGFTVNERVEMTPVDDSPAAAAEAVGRCMQGMARAFQRLRPDAVVILGDRSELLAVATAATIMRIPIVHLHGGEITEGAIDDSIRHALTKLAALHLVATDEYRRRVISMGEEPERVINTGAIGVYNAMAQQSMSLSDLSASLGFDVDESTLLVTYHPATLDSADAASRFAQLLEALDRFPDNKVIVTYPNNDADNGAILSMIRAYAEANPDRVLAVPSLGRVRYLSALRYVAAVVGNSSSGIIEAPAMKVPTVDIGIRQRGRAAAESVIHCGDSAGEIADAITFALSPQAKAVAGSCENPYYKPDTLRLIVDAIATTNITPQKKFYE